MAGLLSAIFLALAGHSVAKTEITNAKYTDYSKNKAKENGDVYYDDGWGNTHATSTNEPVNVMQNGNATVVVGKYSGKMYYGSLSREKLEELRLERAIKYCKENGIKYLPWHFYTNAWLDGPGETGIDIETGKRYAVHKRNDEYTYVSLSDKPTKVYHERSVDYKEYFALNNATEKMYKDKMKALHEATHTGDLKLYNSLPYVDQIYVNGGMSCYYSQEFFITEEEYNERRKEVEEFPMFVNY